MQMRFKLARKFYLIAFIFFCTIFIYWQLYNAKSHIAGWSPTTSRQVTDYINVNSSFKLFPNLVCETELYVVLVVCSGARNFDARNAIRETWGSVNRIGSNEVRIYFLLGDPVDANVQEKLQQESIRYNDIVQENFVDTYNNLTLKSVALLKLISKHCATNVKFVMKCDDDTFVHMKNLVKMLAARNQSKGLLVGNKMPHVEPARFIFNKWYMPIYMYPNKLYPDYLSGTGYVMSIDVARILLKTALETPIIHLEDVYLTGICAQEVGIQRHHDHKFNYKKIDYEPCVYKDLISSHYASPDFLRQIYYNLHSDTEVECSKKEN